MKKINFAILFCISIFGSASAIAATMPHPTNTPQTLSEAVSSAYQLGKVIGPNLSLSHNYRWTVDNATNGVNTIKYFAKTTAYNMDKQAKKNGFNGSFSEKDIYNLLWKQFSEGVNNASH